MEKHENSHGMDDVESNVNGSDLRRTDTSYTIPSEVFEKLYLSPKGYNAGDLSKRLGNPTPIAVMGFIMALTPLSIALMGWRGSGGNGVATTGATLWFGGLLLVLAGLLEFVLGNTFPSIVFLGYGAHFLTFATTFIPWFNAIAAFATEPMATGPQAPSPEFLTSFGFYNLFMGLLSFFFFIASIRTNVVFMLVFISAFTGFFLATASFWQLAVGATVSGTNLLVATGGAFFAACMFGWYLLLALLLATMDLPSPPVFDLSTKIKGMSERRKAKAAAHTE